MADLEYFERGPARDLVVGDELNSFRKSILVDEPRARTGTQPVDGTAFGWDEEESWDALAHYYREHLLGR